MANFYASYPVSMSTGSNASVGTTGAPAPTSATEIGGVNAGNLVAVSVDGSGNLNVNIIGPGGVPTGAATSALQTVGNASLSSIDGKLPALSGGHVPVDASGTIAPQTYSNSNASFVQNASQGAVTATSESVPLNAVGFVLEASSANSAPLRWAGGSTATTSSGMRLEPGRDTGFIPLAVTLSIISESGTNEYELQWIRR